MLVKQLLFPDVALSQNLAQETEKTEDKEKYSIIISPESYKHKKILSDFDQGLKNAFLINTASIYNSQLKHGYKPENIHIFYADGIIDTAENYNKLEIEKLIQDKYISGQIKPANIKDIFHTADSLSKIISSEDEFCLTIMGHGENNELGSYILFPENKEILRNTDLENISKKINAKTETYIIDACYSGGFANVAKENQQVFTSSTEKSPAIISRIDSFSRYLHDAKVNPEADYDCDGKITWNEAFKKAEQTRLPLLKMHEDAGHTRNHPLQGFYGQKYNVGE